MLDEDEEDKNGEVEEEKGITEEDASFMSKDEQEDNEEQERTRCGDGTARELDSSPSVLLLLLYDFIKKIYNY